MIIILVGTFTVILLLFFSSLFYYEASMLHHNLIQHECSNLKEVKERRELVSSLLFVISVVMIGIIIIIAIL